MPFRLIKKYCKHLISLHDYVKYWWLLGKCLGENPSLEIINFYIKQEIKLENLLSVWKLFKWSIELFPEEIDLYIMFYKFEMKLKEYDNAYCILLAALEIC